MKTKKSLTVKPASDASALMAIISRAANDATFDVAKLSALLDVKEKWDREGARKAFVVAMTAFKANPPDVIKNKSVSFDTAKGKTAYDHATLDHVSGPIGAALAEHGMSHRWTIDQAENRVKVTCIITHEMGHSESVSMQAVADQSGSKNSIQAIGSTVTYLQRYTILAAAGVAVKNQDDDGKSAAPPIAEPEENDEPTSKSVTILPSEVIKKTKEGLFVATAEPGGDKYYIADKETARHFHDAGKSGNEITFVYETKNGKRMVVELA